MKKITFLFLSIFPMFLSHAQTPAIIEWQEIYGETFIQISTVTKTSDNGYILVGTLGDGFGEGYFKVIKVDANGNTQWQNSYGGSGNQGQPVFEDINILELSDGYIFVGTTDANNGNVSGNHGGLDAWVVKISLTGVIQWQKCYGGALDDQCKRIQKTSDGGFIITGNTASINGDVIGNHGGTDAWVVKITSTGVIQWQKCFGGTLLDRFDGVQQTSDGGYIFIGTTESSNGDVTLNNGGKDIWTVKTNSTGAILWQKTIGGSLDDGGYKIIQKTDVTFVLAATVNSQNGDIVGNNGGADGWLANINATGSIQWQNCYGTVGPDNIIDFESTIDGGFVLIGQGSYDGIGGAWILKTDFTGSVTWQKAFDYSGSSGSDEQGFSIEECNNGGFIFTAFTSDLYYDTWLVKLRECNSTTNSSSTLNITSCTNYTTPTGQVLTNSGTYVEVIPNHLGCDSTITINYTRYYPSATNSVTVNTCSLPYIWNGQSYNSYGSYSQTLQTIHGCDSLVNLNLAYFPIWDNNICIVGLDQTTGKNKVVWEKELTQVISGYKVYRENSQTGSFDLIGSTNYSDSSLFLDATANPIQQAYRYQITYVDTCGNESTAGSPHKTMHLTINQGVGTTWNLIWTAYSGIGYPSYNIYRGTNASNMTLLSTVASNITSYTDANAPSGFVYYQIEIVSPTNCNPTKSNYNNSRSNVSTNDPSYLGVNEEMKSPISIYPNPASNLINIDYSGNIEKLEILDARGAVVFVSKENKRGFSLPNDLQTGYYMVVIHDEKQLYRKELLIQR
jgi:hypothetical protein